MKLFDINMSHRKNSASKLGLFARSKDNLLSKFSNSNSTIQTMGHFQKKSVGPTKLPPLTRSHSEDHQKPMSSLLSS